ncbi:lipopolysaccharide biosynthesis protein [Phyllobacterium salinisoli]|uniref:Lipopolysaccharide biosynthesis protein n=1 Tax=Phyllobacterium salinisoli TaxID=1899321 RepID=A0A368K3S1_9HYPH|nr:exopolysaccharide transport family protein [Phyllobacterium salinisoli]RCS22650.1 lipopolysaccharide biosynthesis protein [Phyllobacterium salinisoli]
MIISEVPSAGSRTSMPLFLALIKRRKYMLTIPTLAGLGMGLAGYSTAPWNYVSEAVLVLDVRRVQALPTESVVSPLPQDSPVLRTELDVINSRMMARNVIRRLESQGVAVLTDQPAKTLVSSWMDRFRYIFDGAAYAQLAAAPEINEPELSAIERRKTDILISNLRVTNDGRSYTIFITYRAPDPAYAAKVANAFGEAYLAHQIEVQQSATRRVSDWLGDKLVTLRSDLEASEKAAENFRQKAGLAEANGVTFQAQRVAALNAEIVASTGALSLAQARLQTAMVLRQGDDTPALAEILASPAIQALRLEEARVERRLAELRSTGAVKSAEIPALASEQAALKKQIGTEIDEIIKSLSNEIAIAQRRRNTMEATLLEAQNELSRADQAQVEAAQLEREANANRAIYESYLTRYKQTIEQDGIAAPEAQMISMAEPASARASPRLITWLLLGFGIGGVAAAAGTAFREATDGALRDSKALETTTGVPVAAMVPLLSPAEMQAVKTSAPDASTAFGRALGAIYASLHTGPSIDRGKAIAFLSEREGEGKSLLVAGLARALAAAGVKVVVVDTNFHSPQMAKQFEVNPAFFIDEIVKSNRSASDIICNDRISGVNIVAAQPKGVPSQILLAGKRFQGLISDLKASHDVVLIDTLGIEGSPDALLAAVAADRTILVTRADAVHLDAITVAVQNLSACGRKPEGIVLNRVRPQGKPGGLVRPMADLRRLFV